MSGIPTADEIRAAWGPIETLAGGQPAFVADLVKRSAERWERGAQAVKDKLAVEKRSALASEARVIDGYTTRAEELKDLLVELQPAIEAAQETERQTQEYADVTSRDSKPQYTTNIRVARFSTDSPEVEEIRTMLAGQAAALEWDMGRLFQERALALGATGTGGAAVPTRLLNRLVDKMIFREPLLDVMRVENVTHYGPLDIPYVVSEGTAVSVAEAASIGGSDPSFSTMSIPGRKAAFLLKASRELIDSDAVNIENFIVQDMGRALATKVGAWLCNGTADPEPEGIFYAAGTAVNGTAADYAPESDEVISLHYALAPEWRNGSVFVAADDAIQKLRQEKDSNGRYIMNFENGLAGAAPAQLLGRPVYATSNASIGSAAASLIAFNPDATVFRVGPLRIETSRDAYFATDEVGFRATWSVGHRVVQSDGVKAFAGTAA